MLNTVYNNFDAHCSYYDPQNKSFEEFERVKLEIQEDDDIKHLSIDEHEYIKYRLISSLQSEEYAWFDIGVVTDKLKVGSITAKKRKIIPMLYVCISYVDARTRFDKQEFMFYSRNGNFSQKRHLIVNGMVFSN